MQSTEQKIERAALAGLAAASMDERERSTDISLAELAALVETAGGQPVVTLLQNKPTPDPRTFLGEGKVAELKELILANDCDLAVFDNELSPSQMRVLEEELGVQLFLRGSKGMSLTDAGQSLYQQTQQIFQDIRRVEDSVRSVGTGMSGRIKLGVIYSAMSYALHYINEYHSRYPQVELFIRVGSPQELIESLNRGELHALFLRTAAREPSGLQERILGEDKLELIMREDLDPAPELNEVPIERLEGVPMCLLRSDDLWSYNDFLVQECQRSGFTPNVTCHCYDTPMAMQMVLSGFGISFLPKSILSTHPGAPLKAKPVRGLPIRSYAVLAWNSAVLSAPCVQRFVEEKMT